MTKKTGLREVLGITKCHDCGAEVEVRVDKGGMLYYRCDTSVDAKGCNGWHRYGPRLIREMKAKVAVVSDVPLPSDDFRVAEEGDDGVLAEETGDGESGDDKPGDAKFWFE